MRKIFAIMLFSVVAFAARAYSVTLTMVSSPSDVGTTVPSGTTTITSGTEQAITATVSSALYQFDHWVIEGNAVFSDPPDPEEHGDQWSDNATETVVFTADGDVTITAYFVLTTTDSVIVVYSMKAQGRMFNNDSGTTTYEVQKNPLAGFMVLQYDPNTNVYAAGSLIWVWKENKKKYYDSEEIEGSIEEITSSDGTTLVYIRRFVNETSNKVGNFINSNPFTRFKPCDVGGDTLVDIPTRYKGYLTLQNLSSGQQLGSYLVQFKLKLPWTKIANDEEDSNLDQTVARIEKSIMVKGGIQSPWAGSTEQ